MVEVVEGKIEISPPSYNISLAEMVEISAVFVEDTHSLGATFLQILERVKDLADSMKDELGNLFVSIWISSYGSTLGSISCMGKPH